MKFLRIPCAALAAVLGLPFAACAAQGAAASAEASAQANPAISDRYLTPVDAELTGKLDSKNAAVGQEVSARTKAPAKLADGTALPRGTRLVGHVTAVQAHSKDQPYATLAMTFDRAELKGGQSVALRAVIRSVAPPAPTASTPDGMMADQQSAMAGPGAQLGGSPSTGSRGGLGLGGGATGGGVREAGQTSASVGQTAGTTLGGATAGAGGIVDGAANTEAGVVRQAGDSVSSAPRATALPGVMLSNSADANVSGTLMASGKNISLDSGTQITLGVIVR
jgi:hypothetical protein